MYCLEQRELVGRYIVVGFERPVNHFGYIRVKHNLITSQSPFTVPDISQSLFGEVLEKIK